jgi:H+/Cl- antiporter ClcA
MIGCAAPGGVFIPAMMSGAGMGRLAGHTLMATGGSSTSAVVASTLLFADKGTYALMGER